MNQLTAVQEKLREADPIKVARSWSSSSVLRNFEGRVTGQNPAYHPTIFQREDGVYTDAENRVLPKSRVPAHILEEGSKPIEVMPTAPTRELSLADAMKEGETRANHANDPSPESLQPKRPRGRPRKVK